MTDWLNVYDLSSCEQAFGVRATSTLGAKLVLLLLIFQKKTLVFRLKSQISAQVLSSRFIPGSHRLMAIIAPPPIKQSTLKSGAQETIKINSDLPNQANLSKVFSRERNMFIYTRGMVSLLQL